jgi:hypothetical protein
MGKNLGRGWSPTSADSFEKKKKKKRKRGGRSQNDVVRCIKGKETSYVWKWVFIMIFLMSKARKG